MKSSRSENTPCRFSAISRIAFSILRCVSLMAGCASTRSSVPAMPCTAAPISRVTTAANAPFTCFMASARRVESRNWRTSSSRSVWSSEPQNMPISLPSASLSGFDQMVSVRRPVWLSVTRSRDTGFCSATPSRNASWTIRASSGSI
ncbi:hypothetical protein D9M70_534990 [compost metagenome]